MDTVQEERRTSGHAVLFCSRSCSRLHPQTVQFSLQSAHSSSETAAAWSAVLPPAGAASRCSVRVVFILFVSVFTGVRSGILEISSGQLPAFPALRTRRMIEKLPCHSRSSFPDGVPVRVAAPRCSDAEYEIDFPQHRLEPGSSKEILKRWMPSGMDWTRPGLRRAEA